MKTQYLYIIIGLLIITSCNSNKNHTQEKVSFEIYETIALKEIPKSLIEQLQLMNIQLNTDTLSPIVGFVTVDSSIQLSGIISDKVKFSQTAMPVDKEGKYNAIVATTNQSALNNSDIKKTKPKLNNIEIYFNMQGAGKWAELTKNYIGKYIAFTIDGEIYTLTSINEEIKNGVAMISALETEQLAKKISYSLNSSIN